MSSIRKNNNSRLSSESDDTTTVGKTYVGYAPAGSLGSQAVWQIMRIDTSSGDKVEYADGDTLFNNIWDNRASLNYS